MTDAPAPQQPEFSYAVDAAGIGADGRDLEIVVDAAARGRLARRFDLVALPALAATLRLDPVGGGVFALSGRFRAEVVQRCSVTEAPVTATVEGKVERRFAPAADVAPPPREEEVTADETEPPEPIVDGVIELGEPVAEELALALDPFPRAPGAEFAGFATGPDGGDGDGEGEAAAGPFAKLAELRKRRPE